MFEVSDMPIDRMKLLNRTLSADERGHFEEIYRATDFGDEVPEFVQDNLSFSKASVLRGMHLQVSQWQLVTVLSGSIQDVTFDLNPNSPTFRQAHSIEMRHNLNNQLLIPPGVSHGFCVLSKEVILQYKSNVYYGNTLQYGVAWDSQELKNILPEGDWILSGRDLEFPTIDQFLLSGVTL
jgi:dTDP-4-dehydrorhamnose 3,5-epimerase